MYAPCFLSCCRAPLSFALPSFYSALNHPINYSCILIKPPELLFPRINSFSLLSLFSGDKCSSPLMILVSLHWICNRCALDPVHQMCPTNAEGSPHSSLLIMCLLIQPRILLALCVFGALLMTSVLVSS